MRDTIAGLADQKMTVPLSTHTLSVVDELADEVGVLHDGALVAEGSPEELKARAESDAASPRSKTPFSRSPTGANSPSPERTSRRPTERRSVPGVRTSRSPGRGRLTTLTLLSARSRGSPRHETTRDRRD
jgi:ABC-type multidrug transport system ATPase subunit